MEQYDSIALDYQEIADAMPLREPEWYSLRLRLGDLTGLSVLDLACGDGMCSRRLKQWGAARVVGVDISAQMIRLAQQQEHAQPLGIEYHVDDAAGLGKIGEFDRVTASCFLHYAQSREQLLHMVQTVYDNLKPGECFVASTPIHISHRNRYSIIGNTGSWSALWTSPSTRGRESALHFSSERRRWSSTSTGDPWATYEEAFRTVGFRSCKIEPYLVPPDVERKYGEGFWDEYIATPSVIHFTCQK